MPAGDGFCLAAGAGDRGGAGVGLEAFGILEPGSVIADLGEHPGAGECAEPWEAGDDPGVRVQAKRLRCGALEVIGRGAGGVELAEQGQGLPAHGGLDEGELAHLPGAEGPTEPGGLGVDALMRPALRSRPRSWVRVSVAASAGVGAAARTVRASGRKMPPRASAKAARKAG